MFTIEIMTACADKNSENLFHTETAYDAYSLLAKDYDPGFALLQNLHRNNN